LSALILANVSESEGFAFMQCKIVNIAAASVLALLLLTAAAVYVARCDGDQLRAIFGTRDTFLVFCVATHLGTICLLPWYAVTPPTPASRRSYARATVASAVQLAANMYLATVSFLSKLCWPVLLKVWEARAINFLSSFSSASCGCCLGSRGCVAAQDWKMDRFGVWR
jgi:hypothetical protein